MLKNILNLEGAQLLSKEEQKNLNGGKRNGTMSNLQGTGNFVYSGGSAVACECTFDIWVGAFLGIGGHNESHTGPCPAQTMESMSCIPE